VKIFTINYLWKFKMLNKNDIIPYILIVADIIQAIVCIIPPGANYPKSLYWFAAGLITFASVLMK
jgi:hypothetical protein